MPQHKSAGKMIELNEDLHDKPLDFDQKTTEEKVFIGTATTDDSY